MPGGKKAPALFELLGDAKAVPKGPSRPGTAAPIQTPAAPSSAGVPAALAPDTSRTVEPKPAPRPAPASGHGAPGTPATPGGPGAGGVPRKPGSGEPRSRFDFDRRLTVSMSTLWFALGGVLVVIAVIWFIAYSRGQSLEKAKADRQLGQIADTKVSDPLKGGDPKQIPQNPNLVVPRPAVDGPRAGTTPGQPVSPGQTAPGSGRPASPATAGAGSGGGTQGTLAPVAEFGQDPRQSGLNYLLVEGQLDRESAEKIFQYLAENGVPAFAMVDDRGGAGNNPARYLVGVARGFNRDDYRGPARAELETRIKRLGQVWQSQRKGSTDFSRFGWARKN